jgi:CRISPR-associated endonuclease/helicase Cas3
MERREAIDARVDVSFPMIGASVPLDHGYRLFGAVSRALEDKVHAAKWLAIHPVRGVPREDGTMSLVARRSALTLRIPPAELMKVLPLAGREIEVGGHRLGLGTSRVYALRAAPTLKSRLVVVKKFTEPEPFREAVVRQLEELGVKATVELVRRPLREGRDTRDVWRRVLRIAGDTVVGFGVRLEGLSDEHSLRVQYAGIGGRQRFGCGVFVPEKRGL